MDLDEMFGAFAPSNKKRQAPVQVETLEKAVKDGESSDESSDEEARLIQGVDEMIKVKAVENSTLKIGYNEDDYEVRTQQWDNCLQEYIAPKGYPKKEKWDKTMDKTYKFKLDKF